MRRQPRRIRRHPRRRKPRPRATMRAPRGGTRGRVRVRRMSLSRRVGAPGSGDAFVDGDDAARRLRGFRLFLAENAPDEAAIAALEFAPESLPAKLMDAETYCRLLCLRRGFTPLVSGVKCPVMPGGAERARTIVEVEAEERGRGRNLQLDRGLRNAHVRGKVASDSTEEGRKRPRVRPNGDAAFAGDNRAMSKIKAAETDSARCSPPGWTRRKNSSGAPWRRRSKRRRTRRTRATVETDANTDADPVDPDPEIRGTRGNRGTRGAGGARSKSTRHPSPTNARVVRPKRDTAASGSKASPSPTVALRARRGASERTERRGKRKRRVRSAAARGRGFRRESGRRGFRRESGRRGLPREIGRRGRDRGYRRCASSASRRGGDAVAERRKKSARKFARRPSASDTGYLGYRIPKIPPPPTRGTTRSERFRSENTLSRARRRTT